MASSYSEEEEEEEERQTLITQQHSPIIDKSPIPISSSFFQIDENNNNNLITRTKLPFFKTWYLLLLLSIFIIIIILIHFSLSSSSSSSQNDNNNNNEMVLVNVMRESALQALYLLQNQQLSLLNLTSVIPDSNPDVFRFFQSHLLSQISLNKQIQSLLLSPHHLTPSNPNTNACRNVHHKLPHTTTLHWIPLPSKYLFAVCVSGQMSNHLICLEKHMFFAALLNRLLVVPSPRVDYQFDRVLDIHHINSCLGRKVVVTFEEFAQAEKNHLHIDRFICYFSKPQPCFLDDDHVKKIKSLGLTMDKLEPAWEEDVKSPRKRTKEDVVSKFGGFKENVIAIGDVFFADVERDMVMQPGGPIAHKCKTLIEPSRLIMLTAQRFVQTFLGERFIALHFRRHGFLKFCNAKSPSCFFPIPQAAECISRLVEKANTPVIYLATDAAESETNLLQSLIVLNGKTVPLVKRPARNSAEKWDALLYRHGIEGDPQVEAMLDKTISAMSSVFIGASGSTFTEDILRLRKDWGSASSCDEYLCQGEVPNFIADNE